MQTGWIAFRDAVFLGVVLAATARVAGGAQEPGAGTNVPDARPSPHPRLTSLLESSWERVAGPAPAPAGILAYSGGIFDLSAHRFLIFGGGHGDYWGNEVCAFDPSTLSWKKMYEPDAQARYTADNIDNQNGKLRDSEKPYTRHSYNQQCFVPGSGMFLFGGCGPGWATIRPNCPVPPDVWTYSFASNRWTELYAGKGTPGGYAMACCYDTKRRKVWAYGHDSVLSAFDLAQKSWSTFRLDPEIPYIGTYNFHMVYLPKADRILVLGKDACTIDPDTFRTERRPLDGASGKAGLAYVPEEDLVLYVLLTVGGKYRAAIYDCARAVWKEWDTRNLPAGATSKGGEAEGGEGNVWNRFQYDPVDRVALLVMSEGVWAIRPPKRAERPAQDR